jgi:2-polyprenyl-6-hydroxyphenyl methylase/3-demethylubiquinone-9 3-methyltransferase
MFALDHAATAHELARVVAPGGRIALANWTPEGGLGQMFKMMGPFLPTPPADAGNPFDWGRKEVVRELLGEAFELDIEECVSTLNISTSEEYWQLFVQLRTNETAAEALDEERRDQFHQTWVDFLDRHYRSDGSVSHPRQYLLVVGIRR